MRVRFLTRYDYTPRFGPPGRWLDASCFARSSAGPPHGASTACDAGSRRGLPPEAALRQAVVHAVARVARSG